MSTKEPVSAAGYEFTKRKRWADLLVSELADTIIFVLSAEGKVLYVGTAVTELLGWGEFDLLDRNFGELVSAGDQDAFRLTFAESVRTHQDLHSYVRLKCSNQTNDVLFEIKSRIEDDCWYTMARPYPGRNMLNTFLDLKLENQRLQTRLRELTGSSSPSVMTKGPLPLFTSTSMAGETFDGGSANGGGMVGSGLYATGSLDVHTGGEDDDGGKKKKAKKTHTSDQSSGAEDALQCVWTTLGKVDEEKRRHFDGRSCWGKRSLDLRPRVIVSYYM
ncbi:white collar 2 type of transcription factor [Desarmillaria ectypa]|nr:white collar 2 type of transcription factor [Desarmillaria ectypa]